MLRIANIGAGIVGLSSAVNIQRAFPWAKVTIIADQFESDTVSNGAGGLYRPDLDHLIHGDNAEVIKQILRDSWKHYSSLAMSDKAEESGHMLTPGMMVHKDPMDERYSMMKECCFDFHRIPASELKRRGIPYEIGYSCTSVISQTPIYMKWLMKEFKSRGGEVQRRTVKNIGELYGEYQLVINCCGMRAVTFLNDKECFPIRGQLALLKAPWIRGFYYSDVDVYLIPHADKVIVGGVRIAGDGNAAVEPDVNESILRKAEAVFPELKGAEQVGSWAGLRPGRSKLRMEVEILHLGGNRKLPVVHNYGHAGHGVTLSWGSGVYTAKLAKQALESLPKAAL